MAELNPNAKKWVEALRSGKYDQCRGWLKAGEGYGYCCLGVGAEVAKSNGVPVDADLCDHRSFIDLPKIKDWLGLRDTAGRFGGFDSELEQQSLAKMNDSGKTFSEIADIIESQPKGLFV